MTPPVSTDPGLLSRPLRVICVFNSVVWLVAQPPWFQAGALTTAGAIAGAAMWALLGFGGNRPGWVRSATVLVAGAYLGMLVGRIVVEGF